METYCTAGQVADDKLAYICVSRWIPNATNTSSEYVIGIDFLLQLRLQEQASILRYMYIACHFGHI